MKKTFSLILVFLLLGITTTFGDFQIDTSLSVVKQQAFKNEIDKIYITFENNLSKLSKDKQINSLKITITNLDTILKKRQSDTNKFVLYYLRYLLNEKLDYLNSDSIDLNGLLHIDDDLFAVSEEPCKLTKTDGYSIPQTDYKVVYKATKTINGITYIQNFECYNSQFSKVGSEIAMLSDNGNTTTSNDCKGLEVLGYYIYDTKNAGITTGQRYIQNGVAQQIFQCNNGTFKRVGEEGLVCNDGYYLEGGYCERKVDNNSNNSNNTNQTTCGTNQHNDGNYCVDNQRSCNVSNGVGNQNWSGSNWGSCVNITCNYGYALQNGSCVYQNTNTNNNNNQITCGTNQHKEGDSCIINEKTCSVSNGTGKQSWNGSNWSSCIATSCNSGYELQNGNCAITIPAEGILSTSDNNPKSSLFLAGSANNEIFAFRVKATNGDIRLSDLVFTGNGLDKLSNFRLRTPSGSYINTTSSSNTELRFTNMNINDTIRANNTVTYYLVADINNNTNSNFQVNFNGGMFKSSNGTVSNFKGETFITGNSHGIAENKAVVAKATNSSKNLTTSSLRFTITASGKNQVVLKSANISVNSNYDTTNAKLSVYRNSIGASNLVGNIDNTSGTINFLQNNTIDAGSTNTYIIVVEGATVGNNSPDWTVSLTDLQIQSGSSSYRIRDYQNLGELPITETR